MTRHVGPIVFRCVYTVGVCVYVCMCVLRADPLLQVWSEYNEQSEADQRESTVNFLPGMGGFLQSLIYGFAGVRVRPEFLEFHDPTPPPDCDRYEG